MNGGDLLNIYYGDSMGCVHTALNNFIFFLFAFLVFLYSICMVDDGDRKQDTKTL